MDQPGSRDNRVMKFGQIFELKGALGLSDVAVVGANFAGDIMLKWYQQAAVDIRRRDRNGCVDLIDLLVEILHDPVKFEYLTELGTYVRYRALYSKYLADVQTFEDGRHGTDPNAAWRCKKPSSNQIYMVREVQNLLAAGDPSFVQQKFQTRGEAHDFLSINGGNPRFWAQPKPPCDHLDGSQEAADALDLNWS